MVRRDGVRMENNDSMPDICRRGRDKINSPLSPGRSVKRPPAARHKYPKKMRLVKWRPVALHQPSMRERDIFTSGWTFVSQKFARFLQLPLKFPTIPFVLSLFLFLSSFVYDERKFRVTNSINSISDLERSTYESFIGEIRAQGTGAYSCICKNTQIVGNANL